MTHSKMGFELKGKKGEAKASPVLLMSLGDMLKRFDEDPDLDELLVNGTRAMFLVTAGKVSTCNSPFDDLVTAAEALQSFAWSCGLRVDPLRPFAGGLTFRGPNETPLRWHLVMPPIACDGPLFCVRRHRFTSVNLEAFFADARELSDFQNWWSPNLPTLVAGATGSGKTTFLHGLLTSYMSRKRVIILETVRELPLTNSSWVQMITRETDIEGRGSVSMVELLQQTLRLRPDRIVIGEVRGGEAAIFLAAGSTGHSGALGTIHAGSIEEAKQRLCELAWPTTNNDAFVRTSQLGTRLQIVLMATPMYGAAANKSYRVADRGVVTL